MKKYMIIAAVLALVVLILGFARGSGIGASGTAEPDETTGSAVDMSTMPANSEFLNE